jgi:hypothetical protein
MAVVRANYIKKGVGERATAKANIRYIQERPGRDKEMLTRQLFDSAGVIGRHEAYQFIDAAKKGSFFYRLKFSPDPVKEDGKRDLDMQKLTRILMKRLERRLKTTIPWAAALHDDHTDIRHVHILAALPRRLRKHELEALIKEATMLCQEKQRTREYVTLRPKRRDAEKHTTFSQPVKADHPLSVTAQKHMPLYYHARHRRVRPIAKDYSCTCPRCHFPQSHDFHGTHNCVSCGTILHKRSELSLSRKGRVWERSL